MEDRTAISVVIPVFNEAENILPLYERLVPVLEGMGLAFEILFVDDGSSDGSSAKMDELCADSRVKTIHFWRNFGQSAALMAGFDHASGGIIISMDGDLQNDPADIPRIVEKINEGFTVVSGWRKDRKDKAVTRKLPSKIANGLISWLSGVHLHDYGCTLKGYRREFIKNIGIYGEMHRFLPIYAKWRGANITELAVAHHPRRHGESKYGLERTFKVILDLFLVKFYDSFAQKPMYAFGFISIASVLLSFLSFFLMIYFKYWGGKSFIETPLPLLAVQFFLIGVICFLMGITTDLVMRTYYESQNQRPYLINYTKNLDTHGLELSVKGE